MSVDADICAYVKNIANFILISRVFTDPVKKARRCYEQLSEGRLKCIKHRNKQKQF